MGCRYPVITRSASLIAVLMMQVCTLRHQAGAQYSAVEYTRAKSAVQRTPPWAPHPDPASHLIRAMHEVSFPHSDSSCRWYVSNLFSFTPRYVSIWVNGRHFLSSEMLSLRPPPCCSDGRQPTPIFTNQASATKTGDILLMSQGLG